MANKNKKDNKDKKSKKSKNGKFVFYECMGLTLATGRRAADIVEFLEILGAIGKSSIFHHMHQYFLKPQLAQPMYPNDFAVWVSSYLEEKALAERLANVNPYEYDNISDVRGELVRIVTEYLGEYPPPRPALPGTEFFFNEGVTIVYPAGLEAGTVEEFHEVLQRVDLSSIYYHFYEARLREDKKTDDFSTWFDECVGCAPVAEKIKSLDPYMYSTEALRNKIASIVKEESAGGEAKGENR